MVRHKINVTIDLRLLALRIMDRGKRFIKVNELAYELGTSTKTAGKILVSLAKLGYVAKWSDGVYMVFNNKPLIDASVRGSFEQ